MAGHSQFKNIMHRKGAQDAKRAKVFTKLIRELTTAARSGQPDPAANPRLRAAIQAARVANMSKDTLERAIKRGAGNDAADNYEEVRYEGYGPGGAPVIVDCLTDNKVRTVADVRHAFSKCGGNLGTDGSVVFQFKHCGQIILEPGADEDRVMEVALEAGAEDVLTNDDGSIEVLTAPTADLTTVKEALEAAGFKPVIAEITMKALNETEVGGDDAARFQKMLDMIDDLDDVQEVYTAAILPE